MLYIGDVRDGLRQFISKGLRAQCVVTSPPYWGLRDYGVPGQIGLEPTIAEYIATMVEVFRLVREVLADDGTLWLNMGDSYSSGNFQMTGYNDPKWIAATGGQCNGGPKLETGTSGLAAKNLIGQPWRLAFALQQPYYTGKIKDERERIWLAAMIDGEGCLFIHKRKEGQSNGQGYTRKNASFGAGMEVANTSLAIIEECRRISGVGSICHQTKGRNQTLYRWNVRSNECRWIVEEIYPHLVAKKQQARLLLGCPSSGERADAAHQGLILLHNGRPTDVDFPAPELMFKPGYYLRSDVIWSKLNPMPESVTDRPTKAHEYLFLLAKQERYYYDAAAIREPALMSGVPPRGGYNNKGTDGISCPDFLSKDDHFYPDERNRRSVWTIATQPYPEAHFATFPEALVEPCIMAGSRVGDTVLDPFMGSGTVARVAQRLGRDWIGCELSEKYAAMIEDRTKQSAMVFE